MFSKIFAAGMVIMAMAMVALAGDGVFGGVIQNALAKWFKDDPQSAVAAWTSIITMIGIGCRVLLKKVPGAGLGGFFWTIAKFFFGDGVILENNTDRNYVTEELKKKYPWISEISIKPPETIYNENQAKVSAALNASDVGAVDTALNSVLPPDA
jgi:hypothetical protein